MEQSIHPFDLTGRQILVTGSSSGIGRGTAILLSQLGARVVLTGRKIDQLKETCRLLLNRGHSIEQFELTNLEAIPDWVKGLANKYGSFFGLVHAAGIRKTVGIRGLSVDSLHQTFRINVDTAFMLTKGFRQKQCCTNPASVVFISSANAIVGSPATSAYSASKAALVGLTRSLAIELAREGIRVNCLAPGMVESEMTDQIRNNLTQEQFAAIVAQHPLGLGTVRDVASGVAYLLSDAARWVTGQTIVLDGGFSSQ